MVTLAEVRAVALSLPRTEEHLVRDWVKFRVGRIVYAAVSPDETIMGFGFPRDERPALIAAEPDRFFLHRPSDQRYQWIDAWMESFAAGEMRELVTDAWRMVVPRRIAAAPSRTATGSPPARSSGAECLSPNSGIQAPGQKKQKRANLVQSPQYRRVPS